MDFEPFHEQPAEWLETDGLGGFAMGTEPGHRTRRYHALLCPATQPPLGRVVLVNGFEAWIEGPVGIESLSTQVYSRNVVHPHGFRRIDKFDPEPWPQWTFRLADGTAVTQELFIPHGRSAVALRWSLDANIPGRSLFVRLLHSGRDYHHLHRFNDNFQTRHKACGQSIRWHPYADLPSVLATSNGHYRHRPQWYHRFLYLEEQRRGLDCLEDLLSPGLFRFDVGESADAILFLSSGEAAGQDDDDVVAQFNTLREREEQRRGAFATPLHRAADSYLVARGDGLSVIAGYPWFSDWGRDTFIAMRGLCLATGRLEQARRILLGWSSAVSEGMLPNRYSDDGTGQEFNSVDASLWFVVTAGEFLRRCAGPGAPIDLPDSERLAIEAAMEAILDGYARGTRYRIHLDEDGLIAAGEPGVQLTWMDAKVGDWVVTPRIGKPIEVQALWLNALRASPRFEAKWSSAYQRGLASVHERFWNESEGSLYDVIDVDHRPGKVSTEFRPNQLFTIGGLPEQLLTGSRAARVMEAAERLWTPAGPRSLAPADQHYHGRYEGGVTERDGAYHQGTVWPWLAGPFIEAWLRVHGQTAEAKLLARQRFLEPLLERRGAVGLGHLAELADGDAPHTPRGCPFQAWSLGEALRLALEVLAERR